MVGLSERPEDASAELNVRLKTIWTTSGAHSEVALTPGSAPLATQARAGVYTLLNLNLDEDAITSFVEMRHKRPPTDTDRAQRLAWLPVPGGPSLARRDFTGFAATWAVVVPGTVTFVTLAGHAAHTPGQFALFGLGAFYGLTVTANHGFGLRETPPQQP